MSLSKIVFEGVVFIEDEVGVSGHPLLQYYLTSSKSSKGVVVFVGENTISSYVELCKTSDNLKKVVFVDAFSDPLGWKAKKEPAVLSEVDGFTVVQCNDITQISNITKCISQAMGAHPTTSHDGLVLVIDCLGSLIMRQGAQTIAQLLHTFNQQKHFSTSFTTSITPVSTPSSSSSTNFFSDIFGLIHFDMFSQVDIQRLNHIADVIIKVSPFNREGIENLGVLNITQKRRSGKVAITQEHFTISKEKKLVLVQLEKDKPKKSIQQQSAPPSGITFNLQLSEKEKTAKDSVVLPWQHSNTEFKIENIEDDEDYDEEDPDDDLDI
eukprot:TRINITY_DN1063_c0_g1_i1.p1 TRINITY_DN1063_c0_g1~~TRINITY_DN1063_c0_g1_i1.p1  ORF type:complete len:324 (-),score=83.99 TRINITY_DN1063_c0_g1_i1:111-1082(-)